MPPSSRSPVVEHLTMGSGPDLQLPAPEGLPGKSQWKDLKSVGVVTSRRVKGGQESIEIRYYLSSLPVDVKLFARAVRGHWSVENACHWTLDVTFREDDSRVRERVLGSNITWLYRFTLSILKQHPDRRMSLIMSAGRLRLERQVPDGSDQCISIVSVRWPWVLTTLGSLGFDQGADVDGDRQRHDLDIIDNERPEPLQRRVRRREPARSSDPEITELSAGVARHRRHDAVPMRFLEPGNGIYASEAHVRARRPCVSSYTPSIIGSIRIPPPLRFRACRSRPASCCSGTVALILIEHAPATARRRWRVRRKGRYRRRGVPSRSLFRKAPERAAAAIRSCLRNAPQGWPARGRVVQIGQHAASRVFFSFLSIFDGTG